MPKVTDVRDLLVHELGVAYAVEKAVEAALPKMAKEANSQEIARGFEQHLQETREHVATLEEAFGLLGEKPRRGKSPAVEGLTLEHKGFAADAADDVHPEVLDLVALGSAAAVEHHEIASYERLITLAEGAGANEIVTLLQRNLSQEQRMLEHAKSMARRLGSRESTLDEDLKPRVEREVEGEPRPVFDEAVRPSTPERR